MSLNDDQLRLYQNSGTSKLQSITRKAVDQSPEVGSFYDPNRDRALGKINGPISLIRSESKFAARCVARKLDKINDEHFWKLLNVDFELLLNICLKISAGISVAQFVNYSKIIDNSTYLLYYNQTTASEALEHSNEKLYELMKEENVNQFPKYIVQSVGWGIEALIILKIEDNDENKILEQLNAVAESLKTGRFFIDEFQSFSASIKSVKVYSNHPDLNEIYEFDKICLTLTEMKNQYWESRKINYKLVPCARTGYFSTNNYPKIQDYIIKLSTDITQYRCQYEFYRSFSSLKGAKNWLGSLEQCYQTMEQVYEEYFPKISSNVLKFRQGILEHDQIIEQRLIDKMDELNQQWSKSVTVIEDSIKFITYLKNEGFHYYEFDQQEIQLGIEKVILENVLGKDEKHFCILCGNDKLIRENQTGFQQNILDLNERSSMIKNLKLVYANLTNTNYFLPDFEQINSHSMGSDNIINILLIGQSGVGKSTFINALKNFLRFETLKQAEESQVSIVIPVSSVVNNDDGLPDKMIQFGGTDPNENHNEKGQSVTQDCRSYKFYLPNGKILCLIDTPGFGDTRGQEQDRFNMQKIFLYLKNVSHLNSICFLLKPNQTDLPIGFQKCLGKIISLLGENIKHMSMFCFTHTRPSFYSPGTTYRLLEKLFSSSNKFRIPIAKKNIFCFENESFQYLVAIKNQFQFTANHRDEFENSWVKSVHEVKRFIDGLTEMGQVNVAEILNSNYELQEDINFLIEPIIESITNVFRNLLITDKKVRILMEVIEIIKPQKKCLGCYPEVVDIGPFKISMKTAHHIVTCDLREQNKKRYQITYVSQQRSFSPAELNKTLNILKDSAVQLAYFLRETQQNNSSDNFLNFLDHVIEREKFIVMTWESPVFNGKLCTQLESFRDTYILNLSQLEREGTFIDLSSIRQRIEQVCKLDKFLSSINGIRQLIKQQDQEI